MRIKAKIEISNRTLAVHNMSGRKGKDAQASLAIGRKPKSVQSTLKDSNQQDVGAKKDANIFLMVCTPENRAGIKYAITFGCPRNNSTANLINIEKVFDRFINEGKATVRFSEPAHDLCIKKADPIQLKAFISLVKKIVHLSSTKTDETELEKLLGENSNLLSALNPASKKQVTKEKTRLVISNKKDYPITTSFPPTLHELRATSINLKKIDSRIFRLHSLVILDLRDNAITTIPADITKLSSLKELILCQNNINSIPTKFCENATFSDNLRLLDLGENKLSAITPHFGKLHNLVTLKINDNMLTRLPPGMFSTSLRSLNISGCSELKLLPGTALNLKLNNLNASRLPMLFSEASDRSKKPLLNTTSNIPSLVDICSKKILTTTHILNQMQNEVNAVPQALALKVESMVKCFCGKYCARSSCAVAISRFSLKRIASNLECEYIATDAMANFETVFCSNACLQRFGKNQFAL